MPTMRLLHLSVFAAIVFLGACSRHSDEASGASDQDLTSTAGQDPPPGSPDRLMFMAAVHGSLDPFLHGQANEYVVLWLKSKNGFTVMQAQVRGESGTTIDWKNTGFAARVANGEFKQPDGSTKVTFTASAQKTGSATNKIPFTVLDFVVAPVGGLVAGPGSAKNVPDEIFPPGPRNGDGNGDGDGDGDGDGRPAAKSK
jgi:hypothetical protein